MSHCNHMQPECCWMPNRDGSCCGNPVPGQCMGCEECQPEEDMEESNSNHACILCLGGKTIPSKNGGDIPCPNINKPNTGRFATNESGEEINNEQLLCPECNAPCTRAYHANLEPGFKYDSTHILEALNKACDIIETGDQRLLASDGPINGLPPDISLSEWRELYVTLDNARKRIK